MYLQEAVVSLDGAGSERQLIPTENSTATPIVSRSG